LPRLADLIRVVLADANVRYSRARHASFDASTRAWWSLALSCFSSHVMSGASSASANATKHAS
jgi:hypothetical protein